MLFPRLGPTHGCLLLPFQIQFNVVLKILVGAIRQEKEMRGIHIRKEGIKLSLFACPYMIHDQMHRKSQRIYKNLLESVSKFSRITGYKVNTQRIDHISKYWQGIIRSQKKFL